MADGNDDTHDRRNLYDELIYSIFNLNLCLIPSKNSCAWSLYKAELATTHFFVNSDLFFLPPVLMISFVRCLSVGICNCVSVYARVCIYAA